VLRLAKLSRLTYFSEEELPVQELSKSLSWIVRFLQSVDTFAELRMHQDWRQHGVSGSPFVMEKRVSFHDVFTSIGSPRDLLRVSSDDDGVFIGVAPSDNAWYLRFRCGWDDDGFNIIGKFDFTLPEALVESFRLEVLSKLTIELRKQDEVSYFAEIGPQP